MRKLLLSIFSVTYLLIPFLGSAQKDTKYFIEEIDVDTEFEFYGITNIYTKNTLEERSDHFNASYFQNILWELTDDEDMFVGYDDRNDSTVYLSVKINRLNGFAKNNTAGLIDSVKLDGLLTVTDYLGNVQLSQPLNSSGFLIEPTIKIYDKDALSWIKAVNREFPYQVAEQFMADLKVALDALNVNFVKSSEPVSIKKFTSTSQKNVFDESWNKNVLEIVSPHGGGSGTLLDEEGHFICDYKVVFSLDEFKTVNSKGDTVTARFVGSNKSWDLALCKLDVATEMDGFTIEDDIKVGNQIYVRGRTGIPALPVICADGDIISRIDQGKHSVFMTNAGSSGNFSGAPLFTESGKVIGVMIVNGRERKEQSFACVPMTTIYNLLNITR